MVIFFAVSALANDPVPGSRPFERESSDFVVAECANGSFVIYDLATTMRYLEPGTSRIPDPNRIETFAGIKRYMKDLGMTVALIGHTTFVINDSPNSFDCNRFCLSGMLNYNEEDGAVTLGLRKDTEPTMPTSHHDLTKRDKETTLPSTTTTAATTTTTTRSRNSTKLETLKIYIVHVPNSDDALDYQRLCADKQKTCDIARYNDKRVEIVLVSVLGIMLNTLFSISAITFFYIYQRRSRQ